MKVKIWTRAYRPFIMGGNVHAPIMTEVEAEGPISVGKGIKVYQIISPSGRTHIAETVTGALVGTSLEQVIADVKEASKEVMKQQVEAAKEEVKTVDHVDQEYFWSMLRK